MILYIPIKFHENILNGFQLSVHEFSIVKFQREKTKKKNVQTRLTVLVSARRLMMLYISMKFHDHILNGFQVIEWTRNNNSLI